jgi:hypothetical protein
MAPGPQPLPPGPIIGWADTGTADISATSPTAPHTILNRDVNLDMIPSINVATPVTSRRQNWISKSCAAMGSAH